MSLVRQASREHDEGAPRAPHGWTVCNAAGAARNSRQGEGADTGAVSQQEKPCAGCKPHRQVRAAVRLADSYLEADIHWPSPIQKGIQGDGRAGVYPRPSLALETSHGLNFV